MTHKIKGLSPLILEKNGKWHFVFEIPSDFKTTAKTCADKLREYFENGKIIFKIEISLWRDKRSLDANGYCWVLLGQLAELHKCTKEELYRNFIIGVGVSDIVPIKTEAVEEHTRRWERIGEGWQVRNMGLSKIPGYTNVQNYYGSSVYDSAQMARLLDEIVEACKAEGIDTATPDEIANMKSLYAQSGGD